MADLSQKNYYERLGLSRDAKIEEIKAAYYEFARIFHPDSHFFDDLLEEANVKPIESDNKTLQLLTEAYNTLIHEGLRAKYDKTLPPEIPDWEVKIDPKQVQKLKQMEKVLMKPNSNSGIWDINRNTYVEVLIKESEPQPEILSVAEMIRRQRTREALIPKAKPVSLLLIIAGIICVLTVVTAVLLMR